MGETIYRMVQSLADQPIMCLVTALAAPDTGMKCCGVPDQGVDLLGLDVIKSPDGLLDLFLVRSHIHNEHLSMPTETVWELLHKRLCNSSKTTGT